MSNDRKVEGTLDGVDGNAFVLMGHFSNLAKQQGFDKEWIDDVINEAISSDYDHLLNTLLDNMTG